MISVAEACQRILDALAEHRTGVEDVPVSAGLGRVLAEPVIARVSQPPLAVSAMDGWAVRAADIAAVPARLTQVADIPAGSVWSGTLGHGECARIFTGAPLPAGADTILIQENARREGEFVIAEESAPAGRYVRRAGLDFTQGETGLPAGRRLTVRDLALAAAMNHPWLRVYRRPRIAILASGDEIVRPGEPLAPGQIVSSNAIGLGALVEAAGGEAIQLGIAPDRIDALRHLAQGARGADLLVTTGGASVGEHDLIRAGLETEGLVLDFWKIAMRPGKPLMFGRLGTTPMLGLPGNPVSSLVCGLLFLVPAIAILSGLPEPAETLETAILSGTLPENDQRQDYIRAGLSRGSDGRMIATPFAVQDSSMLRTIAAADGFIVRPPHDPARADGADVMVLPFPQFGQQY